MDKLAIDGGKPVLRGEEVMPWPVLDERDREAVLRVFDNGYLCGPDAPEVRGLEAEWGDYVGRKHCLTTNSGTAALHMALSALNIGPGDEVLVPSYTFLASASCVLHASAVPVFVDVDRRTCTMDPVVDIARKHKLYIIEDACQAHGAEYGEKKVGSFVDLAAFSLNSSKNLTGGEGGLLVMDDDQYYMRAKMLRMFGDEIDDETQLRKYNASILGYQYRNLEMPAALARSQLQRLDEYNDWRIAVEKALFKEGVQVGQWQTMPVPAQDLFQTKKGPSASGYPWSFTEAGKKIRYRAEDYPNAIDFCKRYTVVAGIHPPNDKELMAKYARAFKRGFAQLNTVMEHADDEIVAHYTGKIFRAE